MLSISHVKAWLCDAYYCVDNECNTNDDCRTMLSEACQKATSRGSYTCIGVRPGHFKDDICPILGECATGKEYLSRFECKAQICVDTKKSQKADSPFEDEAVSHVLGISNTSLVICIVSILVVLVLLLCFICKIDRKKQDSVESKPCDSNDLEAPVSNDSNEDEHYLTLPPEYCTHDPRLLNTVSNRPHVAHLAESMSDSSQPSVLNVHHVQPAYNPSYTSPTRTHLPTQNESARVDRNNRKGRRMHLTRRGFGI